MAKLPIAAWGFLLAGLLFFIAALLPLFGGRPLNAAFLGAGGAGVVFVVLGGVQLHRFRGRGDGSS
jgi:hypothetical protein